MTPPCLRLVKPLRRSHWGAVRGICFDLGGTLVRLAGLPTTGQIARLLGISLEQARAVMEFGAKRRRSTPVELGRELAARFHRPALVGPLTQVLATAQQRAATPELFPDVLPTLRLLRERGFALFALTNSLGSSIPDQPAPFTILLDAVLYSAEIGACKPEREAFRAVERVSRLAPGELLHVGDSTRADVGGAIAADWHAAYLDRGLPNKLPQPTSPGIVRLHTLAVLPRLLPNQVARGCAPDDAEER
jgi:FMN phosphatase YigB (HAD superfamily)